MTILRDLIARVTFRVDKTQLDGLDRTMSGLKRTITGVAGTALSAWAVKSGGDVQVLHSQFNAFEKDAASPLRQEIERLSGEMAGRESIFDEKTLLRTGIGLRQLGFGSKEAAELMGFASNLVVRAGGDFEGAARSLGSGIMQGGAVEALKSFGLISEDAARSLNFLEKQVAVDPFGAFARKYRTDVLAVIRKANPEIREEFMAFLTERGSGSEVMRTGAQLTSLWTNVVRTITDLVEPALAKLPPIIAWANDEVKKFRDFMDKDILPVIEKVVNGIERIFKRLGEEWRKTKRFFTGDGGDVPQEDEGILESAARSVKEAVEGNPILRNLLKTPPSMGFGAPTPERAGPKSNPLMELDPETGKPVGNEFPVGGINWNGDLHVHTQASDPEEVARIVAREIRGASRKVVQNFLPSLEGTT